MKQGSSEMLKIGILVAAVLVSSCESSDEYKACVEQHKRTIICPPDGPSQTIWTIERDEYPDATDGSCERPDDVTGLTEIAIFHLATLIHETHDALKWSAPMRWTFCAIDSSPPTPLR